MWSCLFLSGSIGSAAGLKTLAGACTRLWAVDGGLDRMLQLGLQPQRILGDGDSLSPEARRWLKDHPLPRAVYPEKKDAPDSVLAAHELLREGEREEAAQAQTPRLPEGFPPSGLMLLTALGTRWDHVLGNLDLAELLAQDDFPVLISDGATLIWTLRGPASLELADVTDEPVRTLYFSLLSVSERVEKVCLEGAAWDLHDAVLTRGNNLGISNESRGSQRPRLSFSSGVLRVILCREDKAEARGEWR